MRQEKCFLFSQTRSFVEQSSSVLFGGCNYYYFPKIKTCLEAPEAKMPAKNSKKKKKSFLQKFSRAFAKKKKSKSEDEEYSSDEESSSADEDETSSPSGSSRNQTPVASPRKKKQARALEMANREQLAAKGEPSTQKDSNTLDDAAPKSSETPVRSVASASADSALSKDLTLRLPPDGPNSCSAGEGSDKNLEAKKLFMSETTPVNIPAENDETKNKTDFEVITLKDVDPALNEQLTSSEAKVASKFLTKMIKSETVDTDSDSDNWTDSECESSGDENTDFLEAERDELDYGELYFTKGKYMSYFFLQMERQGYDPNDVYTIIRYHSNECKKRRGDGKNKENSSSGSTSPNIPSSMRRRLLHRRSADNLIANSPTSSMRHSSPESIRSAPVPLKPRSTSHDALSKRKGQSTGQSDGASMDSLAKQALLAAQVLNLIPTHKARERNFLHGRVAANSLLGPVELEKVLPNREIKIFVGTWNMNGQTPPKELNDFMLPCDIQTVPDMLAIGTQESCSERGEWEAALQETLGPSHVLLTSTGLGTLHLALFLRRDLIWFCSVPEDDNFSTRPGTAFRTKGAVALAVMLFGTSFLFVTAHLTAHQEKVKERVNDIKRIVRNLELPKDLPTRHKSKDVTQNFDCVFWCGDLNFRLAQPREEVIQWVSDSRFPREAPISLHKDQLRTILNEGAVLRGFEEAPIMFPPTYKYDPGTQNFDSSSKQRTPAYTDRILFKGKAQTRGYIRRVSHESTNSHKDGNIECLIYDSVPSICTSDHKPVWGVFRTTIRPGIDTIPLAAGLFNREVYLEGIRRRAAAMDDSQSAASVCSIQ